MIQVITPRDKDHWLEMRRSVLTSTEIAALFGVSPYVTPFELYHRKKNNVEVDFEPNERVIWGTRLEAAVAKGVAEDNGWTIRKMDEFIFDDEIKIGASFDFSIESPYTLMDGENPMAMKIPVKTGDNGLLEIKCIDSLKFKNDWIVDEDGNAEATPQIEFQAQTQLLVSGRKFLYIAGLIGGNRIITLRREPDEAIHKAIKEKAKAFWASVESGQPPAPDFKRDADFISSLYGFAEVGKVIESTGGGRIEELMSDYRLASQEEKRAGEMKEAAKAEMLTLIGDAEKVNGDGWSISAGMVGPAHVEYDRKPYRMFKATFKRTKETA